MSEPENQPALAPPQTAPDFAALFHQASGKLAELAAERRTVDAMFAHLPALASMSLGPRVALTLEANQTLQRLLAERTEQCDAISTERAHLRQELESARAKVSEVVAGEQAAVRVRRLFLEALRGQPYERDIRELLDRCEAVVAQGASA